MDAFESIIAGLLWHEGYWTSIGYKVNLIRDQKVGLGKPSLPRPEIDIVAYRVRDNRLLWLECKSFMDSGGVTIDSLTGKNPAAAERYKVFTYPVYRKIVSEALSSQLQEEGRIQANPTIKYCLVTGKIASTKNRVALHQYFDQNGWLLYDESWVKSHLKQYAKSSYENDVAVMVTKIFNR
jgi:hypothetical protein